MVRNIRIVVVGCCTIAILGFLALAGLPAQAGTVTPTPAGDSATTGTTGALQVVLVPPEAAAAGARWRRVGTAPWLASGYTQAGLATGTCTVEFESVVGWIAPLSRDVPILAGQTTVTTATYTPVVVSTGALLVTLMPADAVAAGAQWRRQGTTDWLDSGQTETALAPGECIVEFKPVPGWITPAGTSVLIAIRQTASAAGAYAAYASGVQADYKVSYQGCDAVWDESSGLAVTAAPRAKATVKIQRLKVRPPSTADVKGKCLYMLDCAGVERVNVDGPLATLYTDAPIGGLYANGSVGTVTSTNAAIARIQAASSLGGVRLSALPGGANLGQPVTRVVSGGTSSRPLAISLTGIVLEDLATSQSVTSLNVTTKASRDKATGALVIATGGMGRVGPSAVADTSTTYALAASGFRTIASKGALMQPDELVSQGPVGRITGHSLYLGGTLRPAIFGWESSPLRMLVKANSFALISANHGVHGRFWAGFDANGPTYTGTVSVVATTSGTLSGEVRVAPGNVVKFRPDQGTMAVLSSD